MGNSVSNIQQHFYILKVSNSALPLCPFLHTITKYNGASVAETDPRVLKEILASTDLVLEVMDIRDASHFMVSIPAGTDCLGLSVTRIKGSISPHKARVTSVRDGSALQVGDQILGIENVYTEDDSGLIRHIKSSVGRSIRLVLVRNGQLLAEEVEIKSDMGCEIGTGILYKPGKDEYYMPNYDGRIRKKYLNDARAPMDNKKAAERAVPADGLPNKLGAANEAEYLAGEKKPDENAAVLLGKAFVSSRDLEGEEGEAKVKPGVFEEIKKQYNTKPEQCKESSGISLDTRSGARPSAEHDGIQNEAGFQGKPLDPGSVAPDGAQNEANFQNEGSAFGHYEAPDYAGELSIPHRSKADAYAEVEDNPPFLGESDSACFEDEAAYRVACGDNMNDAYQSDNGYEAPCEKEASEQPSAINGDQVAHGSLCPQSNECSSAISSLFESDSSDTQLPFEIEQRSSETLSASRHSALFASPVAEAEDQKKLEKAQSDSEMI